MFPDSPFAVPRSSYERPVPLVFVDPCDNPDIAIYVRHEWIPYILGSLKQLVLQTTWDTQDPDELNLVQQRAMLLLSCVGRSIAPVAPKIQGPEFTMADICDVLRWDENGVLQVYCCGEWQSVPGSENAAAPGMRQPAGQPRPATSECKQFEVSLKAGERWVIPFGVLPGDVVTISNVQGIWSDIGGVFWYYPDGAWYALGQKIPGCDHKVGDLDGSFCHMRLLGQLGTGAYFDAYNTSYTVPAGTPASQITFAANNGFPGPTGTITFHVEVCSGATPPAEEWCFAMDLLAAPYTVEDLGSGATWTAGQGWHTSSGAINIVVPYGAFVDLTAFVVTMVTNSPDIGAPNQNFQVEAPDNTLWCNERADAHSPGMTLECNSPVSAANNTSINFSGQAGTNVAITYIEIHGTGTNPFDTSNC